jgi:hypothetical protein
MISGSTRYARQLGFFGGLGATPGDSNRTWLEEKAGIDFTGTLKSAGGTGWTIGAAPSTILMMLIGAAAGVSRMDSHDTGPGGFVGPTITGALGGLLVASMMRGAANVGF